ncbi:hypothetical protein E2C01_013556 [Portunus trituberculatus]|uniref:Uncharacterized protein n=1 Tax=Portunus trituberculatus TaxID=210409 RepID=A0A5B7DHC7_PORTR|nr:hypothetical protein [Portunus trituberculatus]
MNYHFLQRSLQPSLHGEDEAQHRQQQYSQASVALLPSKIKKIPLHFATKNLKLSLRECRNECRITI